MWDFDAGAAGSADQMCGADTGSEPGGDFERPVDPHGSEVEVQLVEEEKLENSPPPSTPQCAPETPGPEPEVVAASTARLLHFDGKTETGPTPNRSARASSSSCATSSS